MQNGAAARTRGRAAELEIDARLLKSLTLVRALL
jgi:hypothetical protein